MSKKYQKPSVQFIQVCPVTGLLYDSNNLGGEDNLSDPDWAPARKLYI